MRPRARLAFGVSLAVAAGLFGPSLVAVATHSGGGRATISGQVTDQHGEPADTCVSLHADGNTPHLLDRAETRPDGTYMFPIVAPGTYLVEFGTCQYVLAPYVPEWWDDEPTFHSADRIVIGYDQTPVSGIDAVLTQPL